MRSRTELVTGSLALGSVPIAIPFFSYASESEQAETIRAAGASLLVGAALGDRRR